MIRKPWPIIIVSFIFFLIPFINVIGTYFLLKTNHSFSDYIYSLGHFKENYIHLFNMIMPSLIAGIAIYAVKQWSYPVFLMCMLWIVIQMFFKLSDHIVFSNLLLTILLPMAVNILYVTYILLPAVRAPYYNPRLRWWETKPRYVFHSDVKIVFEGAETEAKMTNVSEGGLFALISTPINPNTLVNLTFEILGTRLELKAKIVYRKPDETSHGLQFCELTWAQKRLIKQVISKLADANYEMTRPIPTWTEDFSKWFMTLVKTGKGLVPEIPGSQGQNQTLKKDT